MKEKVLNDLVLTYLKKNKDYGNSADETYHKFGEVSYLIRLHDKISRIDQLIGNACPEVDEKIEDTILDLIVYYAMFTTVEDTESRIIALAEEIYFFLNKPEIALGHIIEFMPDTVKFKQYTMEYIVAYIANL